MLESYPCAFPDSQFSAIILERDLQTEHGNIRKNNNNIYINGSESLFKPTFNYQALVIKTSRKYDIEYRSRFYYTYDEANDEYIKIGVGRDAKDCMINRGIMHGGGLHTQKVAVQVVEIEQIQF